MVVILITELKFNYFVLGREELPYPDMKEIITIQEIPIALIKIVKEKL